MRAFLLLLPLIGLAACSGNECTCEECETAIALCEKDDATCETDALAVCDDSGDTGAR